MSAIALEGRRAGVLLHLTSLPGADTRGALGEGARRFVDLLAEAGFRMWQILPVNPPGEDGSPYYSRSVHAGAPQLIDLGELERAGWIHAEAQPHPGETPATLRRRKLLEALIGFENAATAADKEEYAAFLNAHRHWLLDDALFVALKAEHHGRPWWEWKAPLRDRQPAALEEARERNRAAIEQFVFEQFLFDRQWRALRAHAHARGVRLFGDVPIYVAHDSVETWAHRENFLLDENGLPTFVAGVPPDYFAVDGQLWGNPLYDWEYMRRDGFRWWIVRMRTQLERFDLLRIDHFRGLESFWRVPAGAKTAREGEWAPAAGDALLEALAAEFGGLPLAAEDLGVITPEVEALRDRFGLPGMRVLQFAFDGSAGNPYLPHNHVPNAIVYTGTHDNDTTCGWYATLDVAARQRAAEYFGMNELRVPESFIRAALASVARLAMIPLQDLLGLGSEARMNTPGTVGGNWRWMFRWEQVPQDFTARWRRMNELYGRV